MLLGSSKTELFWSRPRLLVRLGSTEVEGSYEREQKGFYGDQANTVEPDSDRLKRFYPTTRLCYQSRL